MERNTGFEPEVSVFMNHPDSSYIRYHASRVSYRICAVNLSYSGTLYIRDGDRVSDAASSFSCASDCYRRYGIYGQSKSSGSMWRERYMALPTLCHVAIRPSSS